MGRDNVGVERTRTSLHGHQVTLTKTAWLVSLGITLIVSLTGLLIFSSLGAEGIGQAEDRETVGSSSPTWTSADTPTLMPSPGYSGGRLIEANHEWEVVEQAFDGVMMVMVPAGCFEMGTESGGGDDEHPVETICFYDPFWIDKYEVTNRQFNRLNGEARRESRWTEPYLPRDSIIWSEAYAFCERRGAKLPTEAEWEYAARGPDHLIYPWGNEFVEDNVVYWGNSEGQTAVVGSRPDGVSWVGAYDMSGNVWEWVNTIYDQTDFPYPYATDDGRETYDISSQRVLRGGSYRDVEVILRSADRLRNNPVDVHNIFGFRCARSY